MHVSSPKVFVLLSESSGRAQGMKRSVQQGKRASGSKENQAEAQTAAAPAAAASVQPQQTKQASSKQAGESQPIRPVLGRGATLLLAACQPQCDHAVRR